MFILMSPGQNLITLRVALLYGLMGVQVKLRGAQEGILEEAKCEPEDAQELPGEHTLEGHPRQLRCMSRTKQHEALGLRECHSSAVPGAPARGGTTGGEGPAGHRSPANGSVHSTGKDGIKHIQITIVTIIIIIIVTKTQVGLTML